MSQAGRTHPNAGPGDRPQGWRHPLIPSLRTLGVVSLLMLTSLFDSGADTAGAPPNSIRDRPGAPHAGRFRLPKIALNPNVEPKPDTPEAHIDERLFLDSRFSQFFFSHSGGDANTNLPVGDPVVEVTATTNRASHPGAFAGLSINCRSCHLVAEHRDSLGSRSYTDFARRSPVPAREDGQTVTVRNSPSMVNAVIPRSAPLFLHFDGEFPSGEELVKGTLTGRNLGWLPTEHEMAVRHVAQIVREDDGSGLLARELGGSSYGRLLEGTDPDIPPAFRLPERFRIDVRRTNDHDVLDAVARLIEAYLESLYFSRDLGDENDGTPFDTWLEKNRLPRRNDDGQELLYFSRHLLSLIDEKTDLHDVTPADGRFILVRQRFQFGPQELAGLKIFLRRAEDRPDANARAAGKIGNCIACHPAPHFTDFGFHNTGATQEEYDALHGEGAMMRLSIPDLTQRNSDYDRWLPASTAHPNARSPFLAIPEKGHPERVDFGVWNVFGNPDQPQSQDNLRRVLAPPGPLPDDALLLERAIARFKTPGLRALSMSAPYLHTGRKDSLEDVIEFYRTMSTAARAGTLRNGAPELQGIFLKREDIAPLAAFLRSLNEDYE